MYTEKFIKNIIILLLIISIGFLIGGIVQGLSETKKLNDTKINIWTNKKIYPVETYIEKKGCVQFLYGDDFKKVCGEYIISIKLK